MKSIGELVVRIADLVEAEGRVARRNAARLLFSTVIVLAAGVVIVAGVLSFCAAVFLGLNAVMHPGWALAIVSIALIALGVAVAAFGSWVMNHEWRNL